MSNKKFDMLLDVLKNIAGDDTDPCSEAEKLSVQKQKDILAGYLKNHEEYENPFIVGQSVISDGRKYKFPSAEKPGIVIELANGFDKWSIIRRQGDTVAFEDTIVAVVDSSDGEVMFFKVNSRYLKKAN